MIAPSADLILSNGAGTRPATRFGVRVPLREAATGGGSQDDGLDGEGP